MSATIVRIDAGRLVASQPPASVVGRGSAGLAERPAPRRVGAGNAGLHPGQSLRHCRMGLA